MSFGKRIKRLREDKGVRQEDIGKMFNVSKSAVSQWENDIRTPDMDIIIKLADYFDVSTDYLLGRTDIPNATSDLKKNKIPEEFIKLLKDQNGSLPYSAVTRVLKIFSPTDKSKTKILPVLGTIRTGIPILADEHVEDILEVPDYIKGDYILRVQGDSMVGAGILEGDLVICKESQVAQSGQIVVALHDLATGFSEATLKYYFNGNGSKPVLKAANPQYQDIKLTEGYRIAGIMVALIREHSPSYLVYQHYLALKDYEEWTEVLEKAIGYGITPQQLSVTLDMQRQMIERIMVDKGKRS